MIVYYILRLGRLLGTYDVFYDFINKNNEYLFLKTIYVFCNFLIKNFIRDPETVGPWTDLFTDSRTMDRLIQRQ